MCRCEQDGVSVGQNGEIQYLTIKAFNEWDSRVCIFLTFSSVYIFLNFLVLWRCRMANETGHAKERRFGNGVEE